MPQNLGKALLYGFVIWSIGFIWGSVVFTVPQLKDIPSIAYVSGYPAISFPLLIAYPFLASLYTRNYLKSVGNKVGEGLRLGIAMGLVNLILDVLVLVLVFKNGLSYFASLTVLLGYAIMVVIPARVGKTFQTETPASQEGQTRRNK